MTTAFALGIVLAGLLLWGLSLLILMISRGVSRIIYSVGANVAGSMAMITGGALIDL